MLTYLGFKIVYAKKNVSPGIDSTIFYGTVLSSCVMIDVVVLQMSLNAGFIHICQGISYGMAPPFKFLLTATSVNECNH